MPVAQILVQLVTWPLVVLLTRRLVQRRESPVAWIVVALLASYAVSSLGESNSAAWARTLTAVENASLVVLFGFYPDGRPVPRWILVPVGLEVALQATNVASGFVLEGQPWWPWHFAVSWGVTLFGGQLYRYRRRSSIDERERTRWPLLTMLAMVFAFSLTTEVFVGLGIDLEAGSALAVVLLVLPGVGFAAGLLKPPRINVDALLWWCLVTGGISLTLATAVLVTTALGRAAAADAATQTWTAAAVAAALALPVVAAWRRVANGIVFGNRPSPLQALDELGKQLAQTADPRAVPETIVRAVTESLAVGGARLWFDDTLSVELGRAFLEEPFPVIYRGERLATVTVSPRPGEPALSAQDRALIMRICAQASPALYGARLVGELVDARARVVVAREDERRRLRRDLHDDLAPTLAGLGLNAALVEEFSRGGDRRAADAARDLAERLVGASRQVREIAYDLRPPVLDDRGLVAAIEDRVGGAAGPPHVRITAPAGRLELPATVEACALRIIQEAVVNVRRHAAASSLEVSIAPGPEALSIEVVDDGVGFDEPLKAGVGIRSMMERASEIGGVVTVRSEAGSGTRVSVLLPVER